MSLAIQASVVPAPEDIGFLSQGIYKEALKKKSMRPIQRFGFFLKNETSQTVGGVDGFCYYGCLYMDQLYIEEAYRGQGWGQKLVRAAEDFGVSQKCTMFTVTTMDWEAKGFYEKLGYVLEFSRAGYENQSMMHHLRKG
ncbi:MAG: N-acetyltransferase [Alphaproteobacteria bacterium]|jgi:ribosomal protein S18 acetylase RimI-like enzyme|nr:N-acetyltransferase [Alphaproteobacteria bacterium]